MGITVISVYSVHAARETTWGRANSSFVFLRGSKLATQKISFNTKKVSEYDQKITQSHNAGQPTAPRGRVTEHLQ